MTEQHYTATDLALVGAEHVAAYRDSDGEDYLVVASMGGAPMHPKWYLNLQSQPAAEIQVRDETITVTARAATPQEKPKLWRIMTGIWPNYDVYQARTDREIPVVVLSPS